MIDLAPLPQGRPRRLVYLGTPAMAVPPLDALVDAGFEVTLVVTRIDKRRGRGSDTAPSPVKVAAQRLGIAVSHRVDDVIDAGTDLGVVVAFGQLIKAPVLTAAPLVNLHFSLLPRWRGAAPVERALLAGDTTTGVCLMRLEEGLDTGPLLDVTEVPIGPRETADELRRSLVSVGCERLVACLSAGLGPARPQVGEPTYAHKLDPAEFRIDWSRSNVEIDRVVRLGVAWTTFRGKRLKVNVGRPSDGSGPVGTYLRPFEIAAGSGTYVIERVQPEGKSAMDVGAWANGAQPRLGEAFGADTADNAEPAHA